MSRSPIRRVLMTGDTVGGVWTFTLELARALEPLGIEVLLACLGGPPTFAQRAAASRMSNLALAESDYKLEWMRDPWDDVAESGKWLLELADWFEPDAVHLNSFGHGALMWDVPVVLTAHSCVLSWWEAVRGEPAPARWDRYRRLVENSLQGADVVTTPSRAMSNCLHRHYPSFERNAVVIPNAREAGQFHAGRKEPLVFSAGRRWDEAKNIAAVARVAPRLKWPSAIAGEQRHPDGSLAHFAGCETLGQLDFGDLAGWYARASIYALPARYEPFGLSPLEAALSGCALVLGDIESLREVWADAALFVPVDDDEKLEAALNRLIEDPGLLAAMQVRSRAAARRFTPEKLAQGYVDAYKAAMGSRRQACVS